MDLRLSPSRCSRMIQVHGSNRPKLGGFCLLSRRASKNLRKLMLARRQKRCEQFRGSTESQRDSATKPRVARNELPWENVRHIGDNPERVVTDDHGYITMPQPRWGCESSVALPRVARSSQPWAELHNPVGIEDMGNVQRLAGAFARGSLAPPPHRMLASRAYFAKLTRDECAEASKFSRRRTSGVSLY